MAYHVNPATGNPGLCHAKKTCPFGSLNEEHYDTKEEARQAYEATMLRHLNTSTAPTLSFDGLTPDHQKAIIAGMNYALSSGLEQDYWQAVYDTTEPGKLWLERKRLEGAHEYEERLAKAQAVENKIIKISPPVKPSITFNGNLQGQGEARDYRMKREMKEEKAQLAYLSAIWMSKLSPEEIEAVSWITSNGSAVLRDHLNGVEPEIWGYRKYPKIHCDKQWALYQEAMAKAPELETPIVIYRGTIAEHAKAGVYRPTSASTSPRAARSFTGTLMEEQTVMEIRTRRVASPVCFGAWGSSELEVLAPLGDYKEVNSFRQAYGDPDWVLDIRQFEAE